MSIVHLGRLFQVINEVKYVVSYGAICSKSCEPLVEHSGFS